MLAFTAACTRTAFTPRTTHLSCGSRCHSRALTTSSRVIRAEIAEKPRSDTRELDIDDVEPFNWVENWYPIIPEEDAPNDEPYAFTLFKASFVLFREAPGRWAVLDDRCSHRLAPLSEGRILRSENGGDADIECAYHGWSFSGCGRCTRIPQLEEGASIPRRASVPSYRTVVEIGVIWMYLGDATKAPPRPPVPKSDGDRSPQYHTFMRILPYGYETLVENILDPEHINSTHSGTSRGASRSKLGKTVLSAECVPGTHQMLFTRTIDGISYPGKFVPPCVQFSTSYMKRVRGTIFFLIAPSNRAESRLFAVASLMLDNAVFRWLFSAIPRWMLHLGSMSVLDGDTILLRCMERELGEESQWKSKFLPLETTCDLYVVRFRRWMDKYRDTMPWRGDEGPMESLTRDTMLDRYNSHVVHCTSCSLAYENLGRAAVFAKVISKLCVIALLCLGLVSMTGNPGLMRQGAMEMSKKLGVALLSLAAISLLANTSFASMRKEFVLTDTARKIYLKS